MPEGRRRRREENGQEHLLSCSCGFNSNNERSYKVHQRSCEHFRPRSRLERLLQSSGVDDPPPYERSEDPSANASSEQREHTNSDGSLILHDPLTGSLPITSRVPVEERDQQAAVLLEEPVALPQLWEEDVTSDDENFELHLVRRAPHTSSHEVMTSLDEVEEGVPMNMDVDEQSSGRTRNTTNFSEDEVNFLRLARIMVDFRLSSSCADEILSWIAKFSGTPLPSCAKTFWRSCERLCSKEQEILSTHAVLSPGIPGYSDTKFFYSNPREAVTRLLVNTRVTFENELLLDFDNDSYVSGRISELNTGEWWKRMESDVRAKFGSSTKLLPIILSTDGSRVSSKKSVKPVYLSLGVHKYRHRTNLMARECIAYMPDSAAETAAQRSHNATKKAFVSRLLGLKAWNILLDSLNLEQPLVVTMPSGQVLRFGLAIAYWICDHPEAQNLALVKWQHGTSHPCRFCLCPSDSVSNLSREAPSRNDLVFQRVMSGEERSDYSFYTEPETFEHRIKIQGNLGVCWSLPLCVLHVFLSQGLVKYVVQWFLQAVTENGWPLTEEATTSQIQARSKRAGKKGTREHRRVAYSHKLVELDQRFATVPTFSQRAPNGKLVYMARFPNGISNLSFLTGRDYLCMIQQLPFLVAESGEKLLPPYALDKFLKLFYQLHRMLFLIFKVTIWDANVQDEFESLAQDFASELTTDSSFVRFFSERSEMNFSKLHMLRHICELVQFYGSPLNWEAGREEAAHSLFAHAAYKRTNRGDSTHKQMLHWSTKVKEIHSILARHGGVEHEESPDMRIRRYPFSLTRRDCPGLKLHQYVRFGMASYLLHWIPYMSLSEERKQFYVDSINAGTLPIEITKSFVLPGSRDIIVATADYREGKERYDFVELHAEGGERKFGKVRAIVHTMETHFFILQHLRPNMVDFPRTKGVHPPSRYLQLIHKEDRNEQDRTLWSIYEVSSSVLGKRNIIPVPDKPGKYFLNEMVI
jgi:hypothetical protein